MDLDFLSTLWSPRIFWAGLTFCLFAFIAWYVIVSVVRKAHELNGKPVKVASLPDGEYNVLMRREVATYEGEQILFVLDHSGIGESVGDKIFCYVREDMVDIGREETWETLSIRRYEGLLRLTLHPQRVLEPKAERELVTAGGK